MMARVLQVLVVDDEAPARANIVALLANDPAAEVVGEARNGDEAVAMIRDLAPDVVLLDVQMPGLDGFGVIAAVGAEAMPRVVFVTAYDHFAVRAFETHAIDYLVKPFSEDRLKAALERVRESFATGPTSELLQGILAAVARRDDTERYLRRLVVRDRENTRFVDVTAVDWIEAADYYASVHVGGSTYLLRTSLAALEAQLDPGNFARIHRSTIVNLDRVRELSPWSGGSYAVVLRDGTQLTLSRRRRAHLEGVLGQAL
jgi:two-component system LytT family response regulator